MRKRNTIWRRAEPMKIPPLSIRLWLMLLVLAVVLPFAGILAWYLASEEGEAREAAYARVKVLVDVTVARLTLTLRENEQLMAHLAQRPRVKALDPGHCDPFIKEFVGLHEAATALVVRDSAGDLICSFLTGGTPIRRLDAKTFPWFQKAVGNGSFRASDATLSYTNSRWLSVLTYPVRDAHGTLAGLLALPLDLLKVNAVVMEAIPANSLVVVLDGDDRILLRSIEPAAWIGKIIPLGPRSAIHGMREGFVTTRGADGVERMYALVTIPGTGWRVAAGIPTDAALANYRTLRDEGLLLGFFVVFLVLTLAWRVASAVIAPVQSLARTSAAVAAGETAARAALTGPGEVQSVARQFNRMLDARANTDRVMLQREAELQNLYESLQSVREEERRRFAREMHDDLGHRLTVLRIDLDWLEARLPPLEPLLQARLAGVDSEIDQIVDSIRRISEDLRPAMLDNLGLNAAIENYVGEFSVHTGVACELALDPEALEVDDRIATAIFRTLQEALSNVLKHAQATRISIRLHQQAGGLVLLIEDNGTGLAESGGNRPSGFGIAGMRERVALLNGRFNLTSQPGQGVRIEVTIPTGPSTGREQPA